MAIVPVAAHLGLLATFDLARHLWLFLFWVALGFAGLWLAYRRWPEFSGQRACRLILVVAAVLRALLLPVPASLSDDVYRYLWEGRVLAEGFNPYRLEPDAVELVPLRDELWNEVAHRDVATVYPPLAQAAFALAAAVPAPLLAWKTILAVIDLAACGLLLLLARRWELPPSRTLWYAWNPLVTVEIAGMGHVDALGVALTVLATYLLALRRPRRLPAAVAAAAAILAKLVPILALPVWARQSRRPWQFVLISVVLVLGGLWPVLWSTGGTPPGLVRYGVSWEFNGPLFEPLWRCLERTDLHGGVEKALERLKTATGSSQPWDRLYHFNYPQIWAKSLLASGLLASLIGIWRTRSTLVALRRVFGCVIVFSATVYPWYGLWVLPWAALSRHRAWLALSALLFLSYLPQFFEIPLFPWIHALIWVPFAALFLWSRHRSTP